MSKKWRERYIKFYCDESCREPPLMDVREIHLPYDVPQYEGNPTVARGLLTRQQYTDLLATPKGYRWNKATGLMEPSAWTYNKLRCYSKKPCAKENDVPFVVTDQRYINDFLTDVWNYLTPEMIFKLKRILMEELEMSEEEAENFLEEQRIRSMFGRQVPHTRMMVSPRHDWVKQLSAVLAKVMGNYLMMMMSAKRTLRTACLAKTIARKIGELTGEKVKTKGTPADYQGYQALAFFLADRLALWLTELLKDEVGEKICREDYFQELEEEREEE